MEWVLLACSVVVAAVGYYKRAQIKHAATVVGVIAIVAIILAAAVRVIVNQVDWVQAPSTSRVGLFAVSLVIAAVLMVAMIWLIGHADTLRARKQSACAEDTDDSGYPEPIQKIEPFWKRLLRRGE